MIVDKHSPQKLMWGYWYSDTHTGSGGRKFLALLAAPAIPAPLSAIPAIRRSVSNPGDPALCRQSRRSRRSVGCPGVPGARSAVPAIQRPRALRPVQSLIRVLSDKAITRRPSFFSLQEESQEAKNEEFFGFYRRYVSKTVAFGKQCEMKTQRTKIYS